MENLPPPNYVEDLPEGDTTTPMDTQSAEPYGSPCDPYLGGEGGVVAWMVAWSGRMTRVVYGVYDDDDDGGGGGDATKTGRKKKMRKGGSLVRV
ncbi:hypothetical protein Tco_0705429 [Tanacetum coccineum]|uniref:Uncharacterized protein n=1 Tax=Tanacetum coccineum TaxID=301880 RepID=A0ABQ4Y6K1_9ASTR